MGAAAVLGCLLYTSIRREDGRRRSRVALACEDVDDHIGRVDTLGCCLGAGGFDRWQSVREHGGENGNHLPVAVIGSGEFAPYPLQRARQNPVLERRAVTQCPRLAGQDLSLIHIWVGRGGRARVLRSAWVTAERYQVGSVLCVQDKEMKQAWCLATSSTQAPARALMTLYGKRWGIECGLRDTCLLYTSHAAPPFSA